MSASRKINDRERLTSRTMYRANLLGYDTDPFGTIAKNFREIELALQRMGVSAPQSSPYSRIQSKVETGQGGGAGATPTEPTESTYAFVDEDGIDFITEGGMKFGTEM